MVKDSAVYGTRSGWARKSPRKADAMRMRAAITLSHAIRCRKKVANTLGRSTDAIDGYVGGSPANPVYRHDEMLWAVDAPEYLIAHAKAQGERRMLQGKSREELEAELDRIIHELEPAVEHRQNVASLAYASGKAGRLELHKAMQAEAALNIRACAILEQLDAMETGGE